MSEEIPFQNLFEIPLRNGVSYASNLRGSGIPMVNMKEIFSFDRISDEKCELAPLTEKELETSLLQAGDLLFARQSLTYEGAGKCSLILPATGPRTWESHLIRVRLDKARSVPAFYFYYFKSQAGRRNIETIVQQVAAAGIRGSDLARLKVPYRSIDEQQAIAEVLGALDDKIAANTKLAATAEQLAASLFHDALKEAAWSDLTFADVAQISGGGTPSTKTPEYWDGDIPWTTPTDLTALQGPYLEATSRTISADGLSACASPLYPTGSILMTSRATIGAFAIAQIPTAVNQGFIVVQPNDPALDYWIFHEMRSRVDEFISLANGATFLELSRGNFRKFKVRLAPESVMADFTKAARALHESARSALLESTTLAATRDAMLPQLMSGKLRVKEAEALVSAAV